MQRDLTAGHTPGPWFATPFYPEYDYDDDYFVRPVYWIITDKAPWTEYGEHTMDIQVANEPDAYLIAAAPDLLAENKRLREALTEAISEIDSLVHEEHMSKVKWKHHSDWMAWLRASLQE